MSAAEQARTEWLQQYVAACKAEEEATLDAEADAREANPIKQVKMLTLDEILKRKTK